MKRVTAVAICLLCLQCGGEPPVPTGPSSVGSSLPPTFPSPGFPPLPTGTPQVFVGAGDIAICGGRSGATASLLDTIGGTLFTLGDNAYPSGTREEFRDCYGPTWGRHKGRTRPVPGNHEYQSPGASPYFEYFGANAGPAGLGYYSFELGSWHAVALNSALPVNAGSAQAGWLLQDLGANSATCTIAYWHHPLFSSGPHGDHSYVRGLWRILYESGADVILGAHDHAYERFGPQDPEGRADLVRGIRQFVVGTGGAPLYQFASVRTNSEARISALGVLKLTLEAHTYRWEFIPVSGPADSGSGVCH